MKTVALPQYVLALAGLALSLLSLAAPGAEPWTGTLPDGSQLRVDPNTRRALRDQGGAARPMWDGVHRMDDGSVVIIRDGTAVPTTQMMETWQGAPEGKEAQPGAECERLVQRVCGPEDACGQAPPCLSARKLRDDAASPGPGGTPDAGQQACAQALIDPAFPVCTEVARGAKATDCARLVERVCGADGRCSKSPPAILPASCSAWSPRSGQAIPGPSPRRGTSAGRPWPIRSSNPVPDRKASPVGAASAPRWASRLARGSGMSRRRCLRRGSLQGWRRRSAPGAVAEMHEPDGAFGGTSGGERAMTDSEDPDLVNLLYAQAPRPFWLGSGMRPFWWWPHGALCFPRYSWSGWRPY